jgi:hypothetical protein
MTTGLLGTTSFLREHKRNPSVQRDGLAVWLRDQIEYLESVELTSYGDGSLAAYKTVLREVERASMIP